MRQIWHIRGTSTGSTLLSPSVFSFTPFHTGVQFRWTCWHCGSKSPLYMWLMSVYPSKKKSLFSLLLFSAGCDVMGRLKRSHPSNWAALRRRKTSLAPRSNFKSPFSIFHWLLQEHFFHPRHIFFRAKGVNFLLLLFSSLLRVTKLLHAHSIFSGKCGDSFCLRKLVTTCIKFLPILSTFFFGRSVGSGFGEDETFLYPTWPKTADKKPLCL